MPVILTLNLNFMRLSKILGVFALALIIGLAGCQKDENVTSEQLNQQDEFTNLVEYQNGDIIPGQYIVVLEGEKMKKANWEKLDYATKRETIKQETNGLLARNNLAEREAQHVFSSMLQGFSAHFSKDEIVRLEKDDQVKYIEKDRYVALSPPEWANNDDDEDEGSTAQETPWGITRVNGGDDGTGKVAWILDSGIDLDHPELNVDANRSYTVFTQGRDKDADDNNGHGTHVAGTIGAIDNDQGVIGVAAGATVVAVKVLDSRGSGSYSGVIEGIDYVGANGSAGDVANLSLGGPTSDALDEAVVSASENGIIFSLAAGNDSDDANNYSPARVNGDNIYTISAMDDTDSWASFSNWGNPPVDYCAPGVDIKSTWKDGGYNTISGTSMASPHAAGVLLLGNASSDGTVGDDPDGDNDPIIYN